MLLSRKVLAGGSAEAPPLDGISGLTSAFSMGRQLLTSYGGSFYTDVSGNVSELLDQSGNSYDFTQGTGTNRPAASTAGNNSRPCADFDGTDNFLSNSVGGDSFITASTGYMIASLIIDSSATNDGTAFQNDGLMDLNDGRTMGFSWRSNGTVYGHNYDTNGDQVSGSYSAGTGHTLEWRHESGTLYFRVDGGSWGSTASGNTAFDSTVRLGRAKTNYSDIKLFEFATFNSVPSTLEMDAIQTSFADWIG